MQGCTDTGGLSPPPSQNVVVSIGSLIEQLAIASNLTCVKLHNHACMHTKKNCLKISRS